VASPDFNLQTQGSFCIHIATSPPLLPTHLLLQRREREKKKGVMTSVFCLPLHQHSQQGCPLLVNSEATVSAREEEEHAIGLFFRKKLL
jgi:hypothetical protein